MNDKSQHQDQGTARVVETWLREGVEALPDGEALPTSVMNRVADDVDRMPQRTVWRRWPGGWRRDRLALSATALTAAVVALMLGVAFLLPLTTDDAIVEPLPAGETLSVAQDGSGDFGSIAEAVAEAQDGDTVLVAPGTYTEALLIERDITLSGAGDRERVVIVAPADGPTAPIELDEGLGGETNPYAVLLRNTNASLENLSFHGEASVVHASGGAPTLSGLGFREVGAPYDKYALSSLALDERAHAIVINGGSRASVTMNTLTDGGSIAIYDGSEPTVAGNRLVDSQGINGKLGDGAVISDNSLHGGTIHVYGAHTATIEANEISDAAPAAIRVGMALSPGTDPIIRGNRISGSESGITVQHGARPTIVENTLVGNATAIVIAGQDGFTVRGNALRDNASGIFVMQSAPTLEDNTITGGAVGLGLGGEDAAPVLRGNTICDNDTNVDLVFDAPMPETDGNTICATYLVAQDGSGDFATIADAVDAAQDGDTVLVAPGTYTEALVIGRHITLAGEGDRADIVVVAPEDGPRTKYQHSQPPDDLYQYAILLVESDATVTNLTLRGGPSAVFASGGAPTLTGLEFEGVSSPPSLADFHGPGWWSVAIGIKDGSAATIEDIRLVGRGGIHIVDRSDARVTGNDLIGTAVGIRGVLGNGSVIRDNSIVGGREAGIMLAGATTALIEDNTITEVAASGIQVGGSASAGIDPIIRGNDIRASGTAITVSSMARPTIADNDLTGNDSAIVVVGSDLDITGNRLIDNASGIFIDKGAPLLDGNTITGSVVGLGLGGDRALPNLVGNTICGNDTNVSLTFGAEMPETDGNEICSSGGDLASRA